MAVTSRIKSLFQQNKNPQQNPHLESPNFEPKDSTPAINVAQQDGGVMEEPPQGELTFEEDTQGGMGRHLGLLSTTFLIIGRIIGTGIFSTPSSIVASVGSVGAALMLWTVGALVAFCGLFVWLEFGCMFPRSGGEKVYLEAVYRKPILLITIIFSTQAVLLGFTAAGCIIFAENILVAAGATVSEWKQRGIAIGVITFVTILHTWFPKAGVALMNVLSSGKIFILLFIVFTGFVVLGGGVKSVPDPRASFRDSFKGSVASSGPYATAMFKVLNSYSGWNNAAYVLNEVKRPVRTLKIAGPLGLGICAVLYLLANVAYFAVATPTEIAKSGTTVAAYFVGKVFGPIGRRIVSIFVALSALGNVLTVTFAQSRVNQELAKEGVLPWGKFWASSWPNGAPGAGLLLHFIPSFIVIVGVPRGDAYSFILDVEGYPTSIMNTLVVVGLLLYRYLPAYKLGSPARPFKCPLAIALFFLAAQVFLLVDPFIKPPNGKGDNSLPYWLYPIVGIAVLLAGVAYWFLWRVVRPWLGGFRWVERREVLKDGTVVRGWEKGRSE
ncbi:hypothetical protein HYALB_00009694 [Hymenoscyphus albidus]|uniref:High affinity methionine permease n=1 Tax=Hymenoscyphus albidus TaxID=595503 RepID=A0A9N9LGF5_9HELO|nr:hypothetical protein HYALB_00009694 [Hymenoscyphus albidus]